MRNRAVRWPLIFVAATIVVVFVTFKLFEVVFVYNLGWKPVPEEQYPFTSEHTPGWETFGSRADAWLEETRTVLETPALSAAISIDGVLVWAGAVGYADIDSKTEASLNTVFRVGSSSKAVTAIGMGVLIDEGRVDLDVPVSHYLSDLSMPLASVTTRQAMSHTAGVRDYGVCLCFPIWEYYNRSHFDSQRDALRPFEQSALLFVPGQDFSYTSFGYNVAGAVIESVTQGSFSDFLRTQVFAALQLNGIRVDDGTPGMNDATFYELNDGSYKKTIYVDNSNKLPSGGIVATPSSMVRLGNQMLNPELISANTRDLLIRQQALASGEPNPQGYALGWRNTETRVLDGAVATQVLHHHGVAYGAVSHFAVYPEYGVVVSVMMNKNLGSFDELPLGLVNMIISTN
jgi:CubicO group peptidase (beta-lactamase class C family)